MMQQLHIAVMTGCISFIFYILFQYARGHSKWRNSSSLRMVSTIHSSSLMDTSSESVVYEIDNLIKFPVIQHYCQEIWSGYTLSKPQFNNFTLSTGNQLFANTFNNSSQIIHVCMLFASSLISHSFQPVLYEADYLIEFQVIHVLTTGNTGKFNLFTIPNGNQSFANSNSSETVHIVYLMHLVLNISSHSMLSFSRTIIPSISNSVFTENISSSFCGLRRLVLLRSSVFLRNCFFANSTYCEYVNLRNNFIVSETPDTHHETHLLHNNIITVTKAEIVLTIPVKLELENAYFLRPQGTSEHHFFPIKESAVGPLTKLTKGTHIPRGMKINWKTLLAFTFLFLLWWTLNYISKILNDCIPTRAHLWDMTCVIAKTICLCDSAYPSPGLGVKVTDQSDARNFFSGQNPQTMGDKRTNSSIRRMGKIDLPESKHIIKLDAAKSESGVCPVRNSMLQMLHHDVQIIIPCLQEQQQVLISRLAQMVGLNNYI